MQRALLGLIVAGSYLLFAGGPRWSLFTLVAMATAAALAHPRRTFARSRGSQGMDRLLPWLPGAIALQLVPLPTFALQWLSPHAAALRQGVRLLPATTPTPLSIDPLGTVSALAAVTLAVLTYLTARAVFDHQGGVRRFCARLAWFAAAMAVLAVAQRAATPTLVMGMLAPEASGGRPFGPFVNRNHFAGWLLMAAPAVAGYLAAHLRTHLADGRDWRRRVRHVFRSKAVALLVALATVLTALLLTLSRSAVVGLGVAAATWWLLIRSRIERPQRSWLLAVVVIGAALLLLAAVVDIDAWAARLESTFTGGARVDGRLVIWRETLPMVRDFWLTGTGSGTYGTAMLVYQHARIWMPHLSAWAHFNQAHNHYLQVLAEGGVLVAVPAALLLIALVRRARHALRDDRTEMFWIRAGAAASLAGVATQSLWEIPLSMPANAVLAALLVAVLLHEPRAGRERRSQVMLPSAPPAGGRSAAISHVTSE